MSSPGRTPTQRLSRVLTIPFGVVARARHARAVHPQGFLCRGTWTVDRTTPLAGNSPLLRAGARYDVLARASRGLGLPQQMGDFFAVAVRLVDAHGPGRHQDFLLNTSADIPVVHHVFLPARRWFAQDYSTCLPYRTDAGTLLLGLRPPAEEGPGPSLDDMRDRVAGGVRFGLTIAGAFGRFEPIGTLHLHSLVDPAEGDVDFDPFITGGGLEPAPAWLQTVRSEAYRWSRRGRDAPEQPRIEPAPDGR
ncbi:MAG: hypothetical protein JWP18_1701 [Solirubrobacterales bacterium]|nr:hypothetical protein [Solirubrobacterales bacterium]